jgi:hypothetical protein
VKKATAPVPSTERTATAAATGPKSPPAQAKAEEKQEQPVR